jgi:hypothetical protein
MNAAWAIGNAIGPAGGGGLAELTSDAVPYLGCAGICAFSAVMLRQPGAPRAASDLGEV